MFRIQISGDPIPPGMKIRYALHIDGLNFVMNYGEETLEHEHSAKLATRASELMKIHKANPENAEAALSSARELLMHVRAVFLMTGKQTKKNEMGWGNQTDKFLEKNIQLITGLTLKGAVKHELTTVWDFVGNDAAFKAFYDANPEAKRVAIRKMKERVLDAFLLLLINDELDPERNCVDVKTEDMFATLESNNFCCNQQCPSRFEMTGGKNMVCSRCKAASYCSKECQNEHWKRGGHKKFCLEKAELDKMIKLRNGCRIDAAERVKETYTELKVGGF